MPSITIISTLIAVIGIFAAFIWGVANNSSDFLVFAIILAIGLIVFAIIEARKSQ